MGRPRNEQKQDRITKSIEEHYRSFFEGVGLRGDGVELGLDYVRRGFTMEAAAKIALAGGNHKAALNQEEKAA